MSTLQAFITWAASGIVNKREQKMLERRVFVMAVARELDGAMQGLFETPGKRRHRVLLLLHRALQRMLMTAGKFNDLRHFGLGNLVGEDAADAHAVAMDMQHDLNGLVAVLVEKPLQDMHHEFHRRVVVVQQQHFVQAGLLGFRPRLGRDPAAGAFTVAVAGPISLA